MENLQGSFSCRPWCILLMRHKNLGVSNKILLGIDAFFKRYHFKPFSPCFQSEIVNKRSFGNTNKCSKHNQTQIVLRLKKCLIFLFAFIIAPFVFHAPSHGGLNQSTGVTYTATSLKGDPLKNAHSYEILSLHLLTHEIQTTAFYKDKINWVQTSQHFKSPYSGFNVC